MSNEYIPGGKDNTFEDENAKGSKQELNIPERLGYGDKIRGTEPVNVQTESNADLVRGFAVVARPERASLPPAEKCEHNPWIPPGRRKK